MPNIVEGNPFSNANPQSGLNSPAVGSQQQGNTITQLGGGMPPGVMLNWNGQLSECSIQATSGTYQSYGKVSFPVEEVTASFSQDIVQHKRPNVPGSRIESMGANPIIFKVKAPFLYGLQKGNGETWSDLFPQTFSKVIQILNDSISPICTFTHPTLGQFTVRPHGATTMTSSQMRNGQIIEFELMQSNEDNTNLNNITTTSSFAQAQSAAQQYDNMIIALTPAPSPAITSISLTQLLQTVRAAIDQTTLFINQATSVINNALFQIQMIEDSLDALDTAATSGLQMQLQRVKSGVYALVNNQSVPQTPSAALNLATAQTAVNFYNQQSSTGLSQLGVYVVSVEMTLGNVALIVHNTVDQLIQLNPNIAQTPTLAVGTQVIFNTQGLVQPGNALVASAPKAT